MGKTAKKSAPPKRKPAHGKGKLYTGGVPGNKGGGRPPDEFKAKMRELASHDEVLEYLASCLRGDQGGTVAVSAHKHISERGYGKVPLEVSGPEGGPLEIAVTRRVVGADS